MDVPFVSIILPAYNNEATISGCIEALLIQDYPKDKYEILAVDNNSTDKTPDIIKSCPVKYISEKRIQSPYAARNKGVRCAKGEIIAFLDADCMASKDWVSKGVKGFYGERIGCVAGAVKGVNCGNYVEKFLCEKDVFSQEKLGSGYKLSYVITANAFYRKEIFDKIGYFEERWISAGDADFAFRLQLNTDFKINYAKDTIVMHRHRSTIKAMFRQNLKWGIGQTLLVKKYREYMPKRTLKQTAWLFYYIFRVSVKTLLLGVKKIENLSEEGRKSYLDSLCFLGWEAGRIIGSVRNRVFYI